MALAAVTSFDPPMNGYGDMTFRFFASCTHRYRGVCLSSTSVPIRRFSLWTSRTAFTGGLNIGVENLLAARPRHPVRDTHIKFEGPVVAHN